MGPADEATEGSAKSLPSTCTGAGARWPSQTSKSPCARLSHGSTRVERSAIARPRASHTAAASVGVLAWYLALASACADIDHAGEFVREGDALTLLFTIPDQGSSDHGSDEAIEFCFSEAIDPKSVNESSANLSSGLLNFDTHLELQLFAWRSPGQRREVASEPWCPGSVITITPKAALIPNVLYRVRLDDSLRAWDGSPLRTDGPGWREDQPGANEYAYILEFAAQEPARSPSQAALAEGELPVRTLRDLFAEGGAFDPNAGYCRCHQTLGDVAQRRLDLSAPDRAFTQLNSRPMSTGFPLVSPRRPASSYLVQKLVRTRSGEPLYGVRGAPMPPSGAVPYRALSEIAAWIADGANR